MNLPRPLEADPVFETVGLCHMCTQRYSDFVTCRAFPNGIPNEIIVGDFIHNKPYPDDNGIRFTPKGGIG